MANKSNRFKNRESSNSNRRKLVIESRNENEIIAHIYRADTNVVEEGTKIDADVLNEWDEKVEKAFALTQTPNVAEANSVGIPRVEITEDGRLKFISLKGETGAKGNIGNAASFGEITASAVALETGSPPQASVVASGDNTSKKLAFRFAMPKGIKGDQGNSIFIRYTLDKITMTEHPETNTRYVGFYTGETASNEPSQYEWTHFWGPKFVSLEEYNNMLLEESIDEKQLYFIKGSSDNKFDINVVVNKTVISNVLGLNIPQLDQLTELAKTAAVAGTENMVVDKTVVSKVLGLSVPQLDQLTELAKITAVAGAENIVTDKTVISKALGLSIPQLEQLTELAKITAVAGAENMVTDKSVISKALGLSISQLDQLTELAKITNVTGTVNKEISFATNSLNIL